MSLKLYNNNTEWPIELRRFPAGETFLRIPEDRICFDKEFTVVLAFEGNDDLFNLALLVDAIRREYHYASISLAMPYMPYARQDRQCNPGESLSVKVAADFINSLKLDDVECWNLHSDVAGALLNNLTHIPLGFLASDLDMLDPATTIFVSPDAGANKRVLGLAKDLAFPNVVRADKTRDVLSGKITGTVVYSESVGDKDFLIVDDICDGGRTFIELAKELRKLTTGKVMLYVTHGIFSAGLGVFDGLIDHIYVSNSMNEDAKSSPLVTVL